MIIDSRPRVVNHRESNARAKRKTPAGEGGEGAEFNRVKLSSRPSTKVITTRVVFNRRDSRDLIFGERLFSHFRSLSFREYRVREDHKCPEAQCLYPSLCARPVVECALSRCRRRRSDPSVTTDAGFIRRGVVSPECVVDLATPSPSRPPAPAEGFVDLDAFEGYRFSSLGFTRDHEASRETSRDNYPAAKKVPDVAS